MSWVIYRSINNKHIIRRDKKRGAHVRRRANSLDSRRTAPTTIDFMIEANQELQPNQPLAFNVDKRRGDSFDKIRGTMKQNNMTEVEANLQDEEDSVMNLTENMKKYNRDSQSLKSDDDAPHGEIDEDVEEGESDNPFLVQKQYLRSRDEDESEGSIEEESDDESIFDRLRDEVQHVLYNDKGPRAIVNRFRDSRVEVMSN